MKKLSYSYSALKLFDVCPLKFYKLKISREMQDKQSDASAWGERVHEALEHRIRDAKPLPDYMQKYEKMCQSIMGMPGTVFAEREFVITEGFAPTTWKAKDAWFRAKIDICVLNLKSAIVLDFKSGKRRPDFFQLELYALLLFLHYPEIDTVRVGFVWLRDETTDSEIYRRADFQSLLAKLKKQTDAVEDALITEVWPPKPGPLCSYCPAFDTCVFAEKGRRRY